MNVSDERSGRLKGAALVLGAGLCWSSGGILVRLVDADGWSIIFWRSAFMVLTIGLYLGLTHGREVVRVFRAMGWAGLASGALLCGAFVFYILSLTHTTVANTVVIMSASPLVSAFLARIFLGERVSPSTVLATIAALAGISVMFLDSLGGGALLGNLLALMVALCFGTNIVVVRASRHVDMVPAMAIGGVISMAVTFPFASLAATTAPDLAVLAFMGFFQLGFGLVLFTRGTRYLSAAEIGLLTLSETVLAPLWVWVGVGEVPAATTILGGSMVLAALAGHSAFGIRRSKPPVGIA